LDGSASIYRIQQRLQEHSAYRSHVVTSAPNSARKILIVQQDEPMLRGLALSLAAEGYRPLQAALGEEAVVLAEAEAVDLLILEVTLPDISGLDVCRKLRERGNEAPIIMLSAKSDETDVVAALELGANDYVTKPFRMREFIARVRVQLRQRSKAQGDPLRRCAFGDVVVDFEAHRTTRNGQELELTPKEYEILRLLIRCRGEVVTRQRILTALWGYSSAPATRTVDNHVARLRQKLEDDPARPNYVLSIYGEGYKFAGRVRAL
jgi:two-component system alkaline phosphatase synthesis response regulator PhoP